MKTKITLKHEHNVLKIDDTEYDEFPEEGDIVEHNEQLYRVVGVESADVVLETVPEEEINEAHDQLEAQEREHAHATDGVDRGDAKTVADSKARTRQRLAAESKARVQTRKTAKVQARESRKAKTHKKK